MDNGLIVIAIEYIAIATPCGEDLSTVHELCDLCYQKDSNYSTQYQCYMSKLHEYD